MVPCEVIKSCTVGIYISRLSFFLFTSKEKNHAIFVWTVFSTLRKTQVLILFSLFWKWKKKWVQDAALRSGGGRRGWWWRGWCTHLRWWSLAVPTGTWHWTTSTRGCSCRQPGRSGIRSGTSPVDPASPLMVLASPEKLSSLSPDSTLKDEARSPSFAPEAKLIN